VSGTGRRAQRPPGGYRRPKPLSAVGDGLVVVHHNHDGRAAEYDFSDLPGDPPLQRSLAALFATRCHPDVWASHETSEATFLKVGAFAQMLAALPRPPRDLDELSAETIDGWWEQCRNQIAAREGFRTVCALLRDDPRLQSQLMKDALSRRVSASKSSTTQSFTAQDRDRIRQAARSTVRRALLRIEENAAHLERWRAGRYSAEPDGRDAVLGEFLDFVARTGEMPYIASPSGETNLPKRYRRVLGGQARELTWQRLYPSLLETTALAVELAFEFGWNLGVLNRMPAPRAAPDPGLDGSLIIYRVEIAKQRRGTGWWYDTENVADAGAGTSGRLITDALALTRFARACVEQASPGTDWLMVWRVGYDTGERRSRAKTLPDHVGRFRFGISSTHALTWTKKQGLPPHSPFRRARRTVTVEEKAPIGHSQDTHARKYLLPDHQVQQESFEVFAAGAEEALERAREVVLEAELREERDPADVETATTDCKDFEHGPYPAPGGGCGAAFLLCLGCGNARIHTDHHPRLTYLHQALTNLRSTELPAAWQRSWGDAHTRLEDLRRKLGEGVWRQARDRVSDRDRETVHLLLNGDLNP
jgi:hypothetical protein